MPESSSESSPPQPRVIGRGFTLEKLASFLVRYVYALLSCVYLFTVGTFRGRNRTLLYQIAAHFGPFELEPYKPKTILPVRNVSEIAPGGESMHILSPAGVFGNVTPLELIVINQLVRACKPTAIFEIGTFDGRTTLNLAANAPPDAIVYTLDLPESEVGSTGLAIALGDERYIKKEASGSLLRGTTYERKVRQLLGDSAKFDFSPYRGKMDFVFVDGAHSYDYVVNDSLRALEMLKGGRGVILWHDYGDWDGVTNALNELGTHHTNFQGMMHIAGTTLVCLVKEVAIREGLPRSPAELPAQ